MKQKLTVTITHWRPGYPSNVLFLWYAHIIYKGDSVDELKEIFARAFREAHPTYTIEQVFVEPT